MRSLKKDHLYYEMEWQEAFKRKAGRFPKDDEYPGTYAGCKCKECNPIAHMERQANRDHLPVESARAVPIFDIMEHLCIAPHKQVKNSDEWVAYCPFHDDSDPSMHVNPEKNTWYCFPCGIGGDAINLWLRLNKDDSFAEAVKKISQLGERE